ncbi:hypothetical protein CVT25_001171, partial [Psilocybe cyanescens]
MIAIKRMHVLSTASFFPTTAISPFPFSLRRLALFTAAIVTVATVPHPLPPFSPRDGLVITVCEADRVTAASLLLKWEGRGPGRNWGRRCRPPCRRHEALVRACTVSSSPLTVALPLGIPTWGH